MDTDRNLLFGVLALQADLIDTKHFVKACALWAADKRRPLADILIEQQWLTPGDKADIDKLLQRKLAKYQNDVRASLAEVTTDQVRQSLAQVADEDVHRSLTTLYTPAPAGHVLVSTSAFVPDSRERYTLSRLHATGGLGRIWLAHDGSLGRDVALKELRPERIDQPQLWARFLKEAQITGQLEHPGIVPIYELGRRPQDQQPFYTMRFVRGRTLAEAAAAYHEKLSRNEAGSLELRELLSAFVGVGNAIAYAHSRGVLHRDLKPQNVILGDYGEVIVLDWGLAKLLGQADEEAIPVATPPDESAPGTVHGQVLGTPAYMAPEQAEGRLDQIGPTSDVYGLGAILYEVLTGRPPFRGAETSAVLRQVIFEQPLLPRALVANVPRPLEAICLKALAKKPSQRYAGATDLADDIRHWLAGEPVAAYPESWTERSRRWLRRHRTLAASGIAALVVAAVLLTATTILLQAKNDELKRSNAGERAANEGLLAVGERVRAVNQDLIAANARERAAREQAQANFTLARNAVEKYLNEVTADPDLKKADFNKLRRRLMETALPFYETFVQQHADDPALEAARGGGYLRLAILRRQLGEQQAALREAEQAHAIFARLTREHPDVADYREALAQSANDLATLHFDVGAIVMAANVLTEAVLEWGKLAAAFPDKAMFRERQANSQNNVGVAMQNLGRFVEAEDAFLKAHALRERLAAEFPAAPRYRLGLSRTLNALGALAADRGKTQDSERFHRQALQLREELTARDPDNIEYLVDLAITYNNLASTLEAGARTSEALEMHRKALTVRRKLAERFPSVVPYRYNVASTQFSMAACLSQLGQTDESATTYQQAIATQQKLLTDAPKVGEYRHDLGRSFSGLAGELIRLGRFADAEAALIQARTHLEKVNTDFPEAVAWLPELGLAYGNFGQLCAERGEPEGALPWYARAIEVLERRLKQNPGTALASRYLGMVYSYRAEVLDRLGRHTEAIRDWDQAGKHMGPGNARLFRCFRLLSSAKPAEAVASVDELAQEKDLGGNWFYPLARVCALASAFPGIDPDEKERYAARAVEFLCQSSVHGYNPAEWMKRDAALTSLQQREDFQKLTKELEAVPKGKGP